MMINPLPSLAQRLWTPAPAFYAAGIAYHHYLSDLTWLLLGKIAPQQIYAEAFPCEAWQALWTMPLASRFEYYIQLLRDTVNIPDPHLAGIFRQACTHLKNTEQLNLLLELLVSFTPADYEELADSYEQLLILASRDANSQRYLAPPRELIDSLVFVLQPQAGESIQDPVAASASFLLAAEQYAHLSDDEESNPLAIETQIWGKERDLERVRLGLMNCLLHDIYDAERVPIAWERVGENTARPSADIILSNLLCCGDTLHTTENNPLILKELQTIYRYLKPQGRAAVIVPDSLLSQGGNARQVRSTLLESCHLHTVLRLPEKLFSPHSLPAQVLFFHRAPQQAEPNAAVWFYDLRHQGSFHPAHVAYSADGFMDFVSAFGDDPYATQRVPSESSRWQCLSRAQLAARDDNLDYTWFGVSPKLDAIPDEPLYRILEDTLNVLEDLKILLS